MVQGVSTAFDKLTPREREILRLIAAHLQSKEIARALGLSPKTVEMHVLSARRRLSGMSRRDAALAFVAWENGSGENGAWDNGDPGNDYRKRPDGLAALGQPPLPDHEIGSDHERPLQPDSPARAASEWNWRHEMSPFQWIGLVLGMTAATAVALAIAASGVHRFMLAVEKITGR